MTYLFVYGTLQIGGLNNSYLKDATYMGRFTTKDKYYMVTTKSRVYPYCSTKQLLPNMEPYKVTGDLFEISLAEFIQLDMLEGHQYTRTNIYLEGFEHPVHIYLVTSDEIVNEIYNSNRFIPLEGSYS